MTAHSRRRPLSSGLLVLLVLALSMGAARAQDDVVLTPKQVAPNTWFFQGEAGMASTQNKGFMSNAGFVVTANGVVVFDALGTPALGRTMLAAIRKVTKQPVKRVIVSHYHADHFYGLGAFKDAGAEIWAQRRAQAYLTSGQASDRLAQRRQDLFPWVDEKTRIVTPDVWLDGDTDFKLGGTTFRLLYAEGAHSPEDVMMYVVEERVLFAGDLLFAGRVPFVGTADSKGWLKAMDKMIAVKPTVVIPGHGAASTNVERDLVLTRDYLVHLRETMGRAVADLDSFDDAYARTDWSKFSGLPAFEQANRINAYGTYLLMEQEALNAGRR
jgi:glyoxylase-like metal-dependent hydrolase (beta-lactamase superfamily II)